MQRYRCLAASRRSLNYQNPVLRIADDRILFLLNCADNILQLYLAVAAKLRL